MQKKKIKTYLIFVFILFIFVLYFSLKDNYVAILDTLSNVNIIYLILGIIFVFLSKCLIGVIVYNFAKREKKDIKLGRIIHIELVYPFFAGITPGSLGGESFEILFAKSKVLLITIVFCSTVSEPSILHDIFSEPSSVGIPDILMVNGILLS